LLTDTFASKSATLSLIILVLNSLYFSYCSSSSLSTTHFSHLPFESTHLARSYGSGFSVKRGKPSTWFLTKGFDVRGVQVIVVYGVPLTAVVSIKRGGSFY
jgi:hypothetical protein